MISAEWMLRHECCGRVTRAHRVESRKRRIVDVLVENLRGLWEVYIATYKAFNVCIWMSMLFWLGSSWNLVISISCAWCRHEMRRRLRMQMFCHRWHISSSPQCTVCRQCTMVWQLSETVSNLCLCFLTRASAVSQQVQSASVSVNSDQVTEQSSRCKLSVRKKNANSSVFIYWTATRILHWDTTDILISQLLKGCKKQCMFPSESMRSAAVTKA